MRVDLKEECRKLEQEMSVRGAAIYRARRAIRLPALGFAGL